MRYYGLEFGLDFLRRNRLNLITTVLYIAFMTPLCHLLSIKQNTGAGPQWITTYGLLSWMPVVTFMIFFCIVLIYIYACMFVARNEDGSYSGYPSWLYTYPVSTFSLVFWPLFYGILTIAIVDFSMCFFILKHFRVVQPNAHFVLVPVAGFVCLQASIWSLIRFRFLRIVSGIAIPFVIVFLPLFLYGLLHIRYTTLSYFYVYTSTIFIHIGCLAAYAGVAFDRHDGWSRLPNLRDLIDRLLGLLPNLRHEFPSADRAQLWFEIRGKMAVFPMIMFFFLLILSGFLPFMEISNEEKTGTFIFVAIYFPLFISFFMGLGMGKRHFWGLDRPLPEFNASQPMNTGDLSKAKILCALLSVILTWIVILVAIGLWMLGHQAEWAQFYTSFVYEYWHDHSQATAYLAVYVSILAFVTWALFGSGMIISLAGRPWVTNSIVGLGIFLFCLFNAWVIRVSAVRGFSEVFWETLPWIEWILFAGLSVVFIWSFWASFQRNFLRPGTLWIQPAVCVLICAIVLTIKHWQLFEIKSYTLAFLMLIAILSLLPITASPLTLHWNRHR